MRIQKIALLTSWPLKINVGSGVVRSILGIAHGLRSLGKTVTIFAPAFTPCSAVDLANQRLLFNKELSQRVFDEFDMILGFDFDGFQIRARYRERYFVFNGGVLLDVLPFEDAATSRLLRLLAHKELLAMRKARLVFAPSHYAARKIAQLYEIAPQKIKVVPLAVAPELWNIAAKNAPTPFHIISVAKQYPRKGIQDLCHAMALIKEKIPTITLHLVGHGPMADHNIALARSLKVMNNIVFHGDIIDDQKLAALYGQASLFCLPSYQETFGLVYLEAMRFTLPVVAYNCAAVPEVAPPATGELCPRGAISCLAKQLRAC